VSIQYSGLTIYNSTFSMSTGTRQEVVNGLAAALLAAGWTQVAGSVGSTDQTFRSATTPQGYAIRIRVFEPGSGNCAQIFLHNATGSVTQTTNPVYLLPTASGTYRVIANAYQFFILSPGATTARTFAAGGVPYVPSFLTGTISSVGWLTGNAQLDTDVGTRSSFRTVLASNGADHAVLYNGTIWSSNASGIGEIGLAIPAHGNPNVGATAYNYADGSALIVDPLLSIGTTAATVLGVIVGQLWDAAVISDSFAADVTSTFDSHNWFNITGSNAGSTTFLRGSLFVVVP